jgi:2Fe-2S ferredoxin
MSSRIYDIHFTGSYEGRRHDLESYEHEYRNLMFLLKDKVFPEDFGQCGGAGRCGTCLVKITGMPGQNEKSVRNEENTLAKMGLTDPELRLSCQVEVDSGLNNVNIEVLDPV